MAPAIYADPPYFVQSVAGTALLQPVVQDVRGNVLFNLMPGGSDWISLSQRQLASLGPDWDGYGADPIDSTTIKTMVQLLRQLLPYDARPGAIVPGADGSLQAEWHLRDVEFGLVVDPDGVSAWEQPRGGAEVERHGVAAHELFHGAARAAFRPEPFRAEAELELA